jgi:antitoxin MazE
MDIQIAKWGNSLALRIPQHLLKEANLTEGDFLTASLAPDGTIVLRTKQIDRKSLIHELHEFRESMPIGKSVMKQLRESARY